MKTITVLQPWASAIIDAGKGIENRSTLWQHRGPLAIHAGVGWSMAGQRSYQLRAAMRAVYGLDPWWRDLPRGAIIGAVDLADAHLTEPGCCTSPWAQPNARVHLVVENPRGLDEPFLCRGALGLWDAPDEAVAMLEALT